jgi:excinuclease UvrABC ATPase subunit
MATDTQALARAAASRFAASSQRSDDYEFIDEASDELITVSFARKSKFLKKSRITETTVSFGGSGQRCPTCQGTGRV